MKDEQLLKVIKHIKRDQKANYRGIPGNAEIAIISPGKKAVRCRRSQRLNIYLETLTTEELNELRTVLAIGKHKKVGKIAKKETRTLAAWRSYLNVATLNQAESLREIRRIPAYKIVDYINGYFEVRPMSAIRRNFINIIQHNQ